MRILWGASGINLAAGMFIGAWASAIPELKKAFGLSDSRLGLTLLMYGSTTLVTSWPSGSWMDRWGVLRVMSVSCVLVTFWMGLLPLFAKARFDSIWTTFIGGTMLTPYFVGLSSLSMSVERDLGKDVMGCLTAFFGIGAMLAGYMYSALNHFLGMKWRWSYPTLLGVFMACHFVSAYLIHSGYERQVSIRSSQTDLPLRMRSVLDDEDIPADYYLDLEQTLSTRMSSPALPSEPCHRPRSLTSPSLSHEIECLLSHKDGDASSSPIVGNERTIEEDTEDECGATATDTPRWNDPNSWASTLWLIPAITSLFYFTDACMADWSGLLVVQNVEKATFAETPLVYACYSWASIVSRLFGSPVNKAFGRKNVLCYGCAVGAFCLLVMATTPLSIFRLQAVAFMCGLGMGSVPAITLSWMQLHPRISTNKAASLLAAFSTAADVGAPGIMGPISQLYSTRLAFILPSVAVASIAALSTKL